MDNDLIYFKRIIKQNGYKFTRQKELILQTLIKSNIHLSAEEIYSEVKGSSVSLTTVYRALKVFRDVQILKEINIDGINFFEMKIFSRKPLHIHFKCQKCNSIIDINSQKFDLDYLKLSNKIALENSLEIYDSNIMFLGLCSKCREE